MKDFFEPNDFKIHPELKSDMLLTPEICANIANEKLRNCKEFCEHQPSRITSFRMAVDVAGNEYYSHLSKCQYCGIDMQAKWEPV